MSETQLPKSLEKSYVGVQRWESMLGHLFFPGAALGWAAGTVLWGEPSPRSPGICPCSALWGIMLSSLSLEQGWLELVEWQNRLELLGAVFWRSQ